MCCISSNIHRIYTNSIIRTNRTSFLTRYYRYSRVLIMVTYAGAVFYEAARVLKLTSHEDILERLKQLEKAYEITLYTLWEFYIVAKKFPRNELYFTLSTDYSTSSNIRVANTRECFEYLFHSLLASTRKRCWLSSLASISSVFE